MNPVIAARLVNCRVSCVLTPPATMFTFATRVARLTRPSVEGDNGVRFATLINSNPPVNVSVEGKMNDPVFNSVTVCGPAVTSNGAEHEPTGTFTGSAAVPTDAAPVITK